MIFKLCIISFISLFIFSDTNVIEWDANRDLTWSDFKAAPNYNDDAVAITVSGLTFDYSISTSDNKIVGFDADVVAHFYPEHSWCKKDRANAAILAHEQYHFNITELFARKFRKELKALKPNRKIERQLHKLNKRMNKEWERMQLDYDKETNHSINVASQKKWEKLIASRLSKLKCFKN